MSHHLTITLPDRRIEYFTNHPPASSELWVCRTCGDTYARIKIENSPPSYWQAKMGCCLNCPPALFQWPGQVYHHFEPPRYLCQEDVLDYILNCEIKYLDSPYYPVKEPTNA